MGTSDVFQVLKVIRAVGEYNLRTWKTSRMTIYHEINAQAIIRFFNYNILNKIIEKNLTVTVLWTHTSEMASKLFQTSHMFYFNQSTVNFQENVMKWWSFFIQCRSRDASMDFKLSDSYSNPSLVSTSAQNICKFLSRSSCSYSFSLRLNILSFPQFSQTFNHVCVYSVVLYVFCISLTIFSKRLLNGFNAALTTFLNIMQLYSLRTALL